MILKSIPELVSSEVKVKLPGVPDAVFIALTNPAFVVIVNKSDAVSVIVFVVSDIDTVFVEILATVKATAFAPPLPSEESEIVIMSLTAFLEPPEKLEILVTAPTASTTTSKVPTIPDPLEDPVIPVYVPCVLLFSAADILLVVAIAPPYN